MQWLWCGVVALLALAAADESDDEGDSAPFVVLVEDSAGRRCGASLVSLRSALTSVQCVQPARSLWVSAAGGRHRRRVVRVTTPADGAPLGPAVLELDETLGGGARAILMATHDDECRPRAACHVVRALGSHLRIVDETLVPCDPPWPPATKPPLCLKGPKLCAVDRGAGVVCEGKLCGMLSRSKGGEGSDAEGEASEVTTDADEECGNEHEAQSVPRWRPFLHCAHTLRSCGREGECSQLCVEHRLPTSDDEQLGNETMALGELATDADEADTGESDASHYVPSTTAHKPNRTSPTVTEPHTPAVTTSDDVSLRRQTTAALWRESAPLWQTTAARSKRPGRTSRASRPITSRTTRRVLTHDVTPRLPQPTFEFEPNRADFKAGEYEENTSNYEEEDGGGSSGGSDSGGEGAGEGSGARAGNHTVPLRQGNKLRHGHKLRCGHKPHNSCEWSDDDDEVKTSGEHDDVDTSKERDAGVDKNQPRAADATALPLSPTLLSYLPTIIFLVT